MPFSDHSDPSPSLTDATQHLPPPQALPMLVRIHPVRLVAMAPEMLGEGVQV